MVRACDRKRAKMCEKEEKEEKVRERKEREREKLTLICLYNAS
jgi:hypothetical protein